LFAGAIRSRTFDNQQAIDAIERLTCIAEPYANFVPELLQSS
jgi:hypothetical protein